MKKKINLKNFTFIFYSFIVFSAIFFTKSQAQTPIAQKGVLDLRNWDFEKDGYIGLKGEWAFFYSDFLKSSDFDSIQNPKFITTPGIWNEYEWLGKQLQGHGYSTYRLLVILPHNEHRLMFRSLDQATAFKVFLNNQLLGKSGNVGTTREEMIPKADVIHEGFETDSDTLDIVIQVSNFYHRKGGLWHDIQLGKEKDILKLRNSLLSIDLFICGALVIMAFYHVLFYFLRRADLSSLFFSCLCFIVPLRILTTGEKYLTEIYPDIGWEWKTRLEYISIYLILSYLGIFFHSIFPKEVRKSLSLFFFYCGWVFTAFTLFLDANTYSYFVLIYFPLIGFAILMAVFVLVKAVYLKREGAIIFAVGTSILCLTVTNDMLYNNLIISTVYLTPVGFLFFFFSQASILSLRTTKAFIKVEKLSDELKSNNQTLEERVYKRTEELQDLNEEMHRMVASLNEALEFGNTQKSILEEQNKDITASITYAQRIQQAILPSIQDIEKVLPQSFILYKPKDIVSGDFYWFSEKNYKIIIAAADCTGHGIPGAFMSMISNDLLNEIVNMRNIREPDKILNELRLGIRKALKQDQNNTQDGLDISVCSIDVYPKELYDVLGKPKLEFAGVGNPMICVLESKLKIVKADKMIIGGFNNYGEEKDFTKYSIEIPEEAGNLIFYIYSDGYQDQFGGEKVKKFMTRRFHELLFDIHHLDMKEQKKILDETIQKWMSDGNQKQVDDILVVGVKL